MKTSVYSCKIHFIPPLTYGDAFSYIFLKQRWTNSAPEVPWCTKIEQIRNLFNLQQNIEFIYHKLNNIVEYNYLSFSTCCIMTNKLKIPQSPPTDGYKNVTSTLTLTWDSGLRTPLGSLRDSALNAGAFAGTGKGQTRSWSRATRTM